MAFPRLNDEKVMQIRVNEFHAMRFKQAREVAVKWLMPVVGVAVGLYIWKGMAGGL